MVSVSLPSPIPLSTCSLSDFINCVFVLTEFIDVGKKIEALEILCDVLRSRKHRTWQKNHADIMVKYLELCVELRKSYIAKEGIYQYKIICQQTQIKSFEDVVRKYLELAEGKAEAAKEAAQAATVDVDDLDNLATPENILLSAVSSEVSQDRTDRVLLLPWVKFLWESYRQCLDLLKNNARTEKLYHDIAHKAFQFCIKFNRKTEFRKLCDNLHTHLDILKKQQQQLTQLQPTTHAVQNIVNLSNPESQALHLETRLQQLDCAITMELWQEAYKATDDIKRFNLMNLSKKPLKPQLMASYYHKLALVFYKANCPLFHAAALLRHFLLTKEWRKNIKEEEVQRMASKVVAATISMPIPPSRPEIDKLVDTEENVVENHHRNLASLLGLSVVVPSRSSLIRDLKRMNILNYAYVELQQLYHWLEQDFDPLLLCKRVEGVIAFIEKTDAGSTDLKAYIQPLKEVAIVRLLKEISQIYSTIQISRVLELCPFADQITLEHFVVSAARRNDLPVRIDHRRGCLHFGNGVVSSVSQDVVEGPHIQSMPSSQIRQQLVNMFSALQNARALIEPEKIKSNRDKLKTRIMIDYERNKNVQHRKMLERSMIIEQRKEKIAKLQQEMLAQEELKMEEQQQRLRREEEARIKKENEERIRLRQAQEEEDLKRRMAKDTIDNMRLTEAGQRILETFGESELADLKVEDIKSKQWEQLEKERKEQIARQQKLERKVDHLERAKRLEELSLLEAAAEKDKILNKEIFEKMELQRIEELKAERILALEHRDRLLRMKSEASQFAQKIKSYRYAEYEEKLNDWKYKIAQARASRLEERKKKREEDRRREYHRQKKEEEEKKREEEKRIQMEKDKKEREEERAKLEAIAEKQRQREAEIEAKQREREEALRKQEPSIIPVREMEKSRADKGSWERSGVGLQGDDIRQRNIAPQEPERDWRGQQGQTREPASESGQQKWKPRRLMEDQQQANPDDKRKENETWQRNRPSGPSERQPLADNRGEDRPPKPFIERHQAPVHDEPSDWRKGGGGSAAIPPRDSGEQDRRRRDFGPSEGGRRDDGRNDRRGFNRGGPRDSGHRGYEEQRHGGFDEHRGPTRSGHDAVPRNDKEDWSRGPRDGRDAQKPRKVIDVPPHLRKTNGKLTNARVTLNFIKFILVEPTPPSQQRSQAPKDGEEGWTSVKKR